MHHHHNFILGNVMVEFQICCIAECHLGKNATLRKFGTALVGTQSYRDRTKLCLMCNTMIQLSVAPIIALYPREEYDRISDHLYN